MLRSLVDQIDLCRITFSLSVVTLTLNLWKQVVVAIPVYRQRLERDDERDCWCRAGSFGYG